MAGQAGPVQTCPAGSDRPAEIGLQHSTGRLASRGLEALGERSAVAREITAERAFQRQTCGGEVRRAHERSTQSWLLALERPDGAGLARRVVQGYWFAMPR